MFEPEDVLALDERKWSRDYSEKGADPAIARLMKQSQQGRLDAWEEKAGLTGEGEEWETGSLRDIYKKIDLRDIIYRAVQRAYGKETN